MTCYVLLCSGALETPAINAKVCNQLMPMPSSPPFCHALRGSVVHQTVVAVEVGDWYAHTRQDVHNMCEASCRCILTRPADTLEHPSHALAPPGLMAHAPTLPVGSSAEFLFVVPRVSATSAGPCRATFGEPQVDVNPNLK